MNDVEATLVRTAFHESAHAIVAELLGIRVDVVSIRPAEHHRGVTIHASFGYDNGATELLGRRHGKDLLARWGSVPYPFFDAEERRRAEVSIMVSLAGRMGEFLMPEFPTRGYRDDTADIDQERAISAAVGLTAEQSAWLDDAEHRAARLNDDDAGFETALWNTGQEAAGALVHYLSWETRRLVSSPLVRSLVPLVVDQLLTHEVIPGETVREIRGVRHWRNPDAQQGGNDGASSSQAERSIPDPRRHTAQSTVGLYEGDPEKRSWAVRRRGDRHGRRPAGSRRAGVLLTANRPCRWIVLPA